jgi:hypothetical protein
MDHFNFFVVFVTSRDSCIPFQFPHRSVRTNISSNKHAIFLASDKQYGWLLKVSKAWKGLRTVDRETDGWRAGGRIIRA